VNDSFFRSTSTFLGVESFVDTEHTESVCEEVENDELFELSNSSVGIRF